MNTHDAHYDALETRDPEERERAQMAALTDHVALAKEKAPYFAEILKDVEPGDVTDRSQLAKLPVTRKSGLIARQGEMPPFGGLNAMAVEETIRILVSPGPIYEPQGSRADFWRTARAIYAAGIRGGELVHNSFAYHLTPGGWIMDAGAQALGCPVVPAGAGNSEQQARAIAHLRPPAFAGTPDYLKTILDKGEELGLDLQCITKATVAGGPLFPALRAEYAERGVSVLQCYVTADLGLVAYESLAAEGGPNEGMIVDEGLILEIVRPGTGDPVPEGEVGEVVATLLNPDYPLIRFATGDLSAVLPGRSPCGRTNLRIKGWMGRANQTTKVKGQFVHLEQVARILDRHPEIAKARLVVENRDGRDVMTLVCESSGRDDALAQRIAETLQAVSQLKGEVSLVDPGVLPNDGKVIDDKRDYG